MNWKKQMMLPVLIVAGLTAGYLLEVTTGGDQNVTRNGRTDDRADRVVSLAPSITDVFLALEAEEKLVGVTRFCPRISELDKVARVGGFTDTNYEALISLDPDLVVLKTSAQVEQRQRIRVAGIPTLAVKQETIKDIYRSISRIGIRIGRAQKASRLVGKIKKTLRFIRKRVSSKDKPSVLITTPQSRGNGRIEQVTVAGPGTFLGQMIELAGGKNAYRGFVSYPTISAEGLLRMNPDVIFELVPDLDQKQFARRDIRRDWQSLRGITAVKEGRFFVLDQEYLLHPGPYFIRTVELMVRKLYPEKNWDRTFGNKLRYGHEPADS